MSNSENSSPEAADLKTEVAPIKEGGEPTTAAPTVVASSSRISDEPTRPEMSALTIGRMMGIATSSELKILEGKFDVLSSKVNVLATRVDKIVSMLSSAPRGSDFERIEVQIGSVKTVLKEFMTANGMDVKKEDTPITKDAIKKYIDRGTKLE